jgi:hypothetical protein
MRRKSITIAAVGLWAVALLAVAVLVAERRRGQVPPRPTGPGPIAIPTPTPISAPIPDGLRDVLLGARRVVVVEGPPVDDPRGVTLWDADLTATAASAIVDELRAEGFRRASGSRSPAPPVVARVRTLGPGGRDPSSPVVAAFRADALVFVAVGSIRLQPEGADAIGCDYDGKGWIRLPGPGVDPRLAWDRSGRLRATRDPAFDPRRTAAEMARGWGRELIGPDLALRLGRGEKLADSPRSGRPTTNTPGAAP